MYAQCNKQAFQARRTLVGFDPISHDAARVMVCSSAQTVLFSFNEVVLKSTGLLRKGSRERTTSAGWCHDTSRFDGGCPCSPLRRALPVCSRAEQTALGTQSGCAPRWRPRARLTARTGGQDRPSTAGCAWKSAICLKQGADAVTRFILITMVSRFGLKRD